MFGLGMTELLVIGGLGALIFGVKRLPEMGKGLGQAMRGFTKEVRAIKQDAAEIEANVREAERAVKKELDDVRRA